MDMATRPLEKFCPNCMADMERTADICPNCGFDIAAYRHPQAALPCGMVLRKKYLLGRTLGIGGFGITYLGQNKSTGRKVAIKEYYPAQLAKRVREGPGKYRVLPIREEKHGLFLEGVQDYLREGKRLALFREMPNIVSVLEYFTDNGTAYLVMDYLDGISLHRYLQLRGGKLEAGQALELLQPVLYALVLMHGQKLIHRDISPDNIMITENDTAVLIDFGASRRFDEPETEGFGLLKPGYASPEQYVKKGRLGPWTDVYGFCAVWYRAVTGIVPAGGKRVTRQQKLPAPSQLGIHMPLELERILMKGLEGESSRRYQDLKQLYADVCRYQEQRDSQRQRDISFQERCREELETVNGTRIQYLGQQDGRKKQITEKRFFWLAVVCGVLLLLLCFFLAGMLMKLS